jgi:hypothetical protein
VNLSKSNYQTHIYFISLIAIHYLISIIFIGQVIVEPHDNLDNLVVYDHVISKIYKGDIEKLNYFLSGEIKWYYLEKLFYPINILHYILNDKLFYFTNDILKKLFAYFSFYLLAKSLSVSRFNAALGGVLYSTFVYIKMPVGIGLSFLPYILYLLLNKNTLNKKHYLFLFLIGLNSSLIQDFFSFILLIPLSLLLSTKKKNLNIYLQIFSIILISLILANIHLIIGSTVGDSIHRGIWDLKNADITTSFISSFKSLFFTSSENLLIIFYTPLNFLSALLLIFSLFSEQKNIRMIFFFIVSILILRSILNYNLIDNIFIGIFDVLKGYNFKRVDRIIILAYTLLFVLFITSLKNKNFKNFLYFISLLSILAIQLKTPLPRIGQYFLKKNMQTEQFIEAKKVFLEKKYIEFFDIVTNKTNFNNKKTSLNVSINKTFDNHYKFKDYTFIRNIVKNSRVMSVGLDPMVAVMNDIRVIDGYHNVYPLSYKIKFRKVIEAELEKNIMLKNYYDSWGSRVYAFYTNKNNIELNFQSAKDLGADYVISKFPIENNNLKIVCYKCNNSNQLYLYKIL